jgi:glycosyltransferase involved in cell wall biosynthesis
MLSGEFSPVRAGIATYAGAMALAATRLGCDVTLAVPDYGQQLEQADAADYPFTIIRYHSGAHTAARIPQKVALTYQLARSGAFDVVHGADWTFLHAIGLAATISPAIRQARLSGTIHGSDVLIVANSAGLRLLYRPRLFKPLHSIFTNSRYTRDLFLQTFPAVPAAQVSVSRLGVSPYWFEACETYPAGLGLPQDKLILTTVARLTPRKGHPAMLRALACLPAALKERICYCIAGPCVDREYETHLRGLAANTGCEVIFAGELPRDDIRRLYAATSLFCLLGEQCGNYVEGFGLVYLEAAAQKTPSLAADVGGVRDAVIDGQTGVLLKSSEPEAVASVLTELLQDASALRRLGEGACRWARECTWDACAARTFGLDEAV